ncbi:hypothetical protein AAGS40_20630 [Paraburkholderia sp. PREW-6R]|uniref:hypothetical protein n=1 Tax=Paraburkholderia sp. PREW-6R TaxID=3141544 RepID=UPI0031F5C538
MKRLAELDGLSGSTVHLDASPRWEGGEEKYSDGMDFPADQPAALDAAQARQGADA